MDLSYIDDGQIYRLVHLVRSQLMNASIAIRRAKREGFTSECVEYLQVVTEGTHFDDRQQQGIPDIIDALESMLSEGYGIDLETDPDEDADEEDEEMEDEESDVVIEA